MLVVENVVTDLSSFVSFKYSPVVERRPAFYFLMEGMYLDIKKAPRMRGAHFITEEGTLS